MHRCTRGSLHTMKVKTPSIKIIIAIVISIILWSALIYFVGADTIVEKIGVENGLLIMFLVSLFGGMSSIGGATYVATAATRTVKSLSFACFQVAILSAPNTCVTASTASRQPVSSSARKPP